MNCLFEKCASSYDLGRKMALKLPRPKTDMVKKSCSYKSIIIIINYSVECPRKPNKFMTLTLLKSHSSVFLSHNDVLCRIFIGRIHIRRRETRSRRNSVDENTDWYEFKDGKPS